MTKNVRALNLSNCCAIVVYEVLRQRNYEGLLFDEPHKDKEFINLDLNIKKVLDNKITIVI